MVLMQHSTRNASRTNLSITIRQRQSNIAQEERITHTFSLCQAQNSNIHFQYSWICLASDVNGVVHGSEVGLLAAKNRVVLVRAGAIYHYIQCSLAETME
jgi:hypothetical protein